MSETVSSKSVSSKVKRSAKWYGRVPASVSLDLSISSDAVRVYSLLALSVYQGSVARVGMRQIGQIMGKSAATIKRRIDELVNAGHIKANAGKLGERAYYELLSPVFGQKQGRHDVIVSSPRGKRLVSVEEKIA